MATEEEIKQDRKAQEAFWDKQVVKGFKFFVPLKSLIEQPEGRKMRPVSKSHVQRLKENFQIEVRQNIENMYPLHVEIYGNFPSEVMGDNTRLAKYLNTTKFGTITGNHRRVCWHELSQEQPERKAVFETIPCFIYQNLSVHEVRKLSRADNERSGCIKQSDFADELYGIRQFAYNLATQANVDIDDPPENRRSTRAGIWSKAAKEEWRAEINTYRTKNKIGPNTVNNWVTLSCWPKRTFDALIRCVYKFNWTSPSSIKDFLGMPDTKRCEFLEKLADGKMEYDRARMVRYN